MKPPEKNPPPKAPAARRKYSRPVLREYGTIRAITRNTSNKNVNADGAGMNAKT